MIQIPPRGIYIARMDNVSISAARTLVQYNGAATIIAVPLQFGLTFNSVASTAIRVRVAKRTTAGTGSAFTLVRLSGAPTPAGSATNNHTAEGTLGDTLFDDFVNYLEPGKPFLLPIPEGRIVLAPSERISIDLPSAPGAAVNISAHIVVAEVG